MASTLRKLRLPDGATLLLDPMPERSSVVIGVFSRHGSRDESIPGITHFLEHMLFKGTQHRSNFEIISTIEDTGGYLDADTTHDYLGLYARVLKEHFPLAMELLGDMVSSPRFAEEDVALEKSVVLEEFKSFLETPDDYVFYLLFDALFPGHPLGREIMGTLPSIQGFTGEQVRRRWQEAFSPDSVVLVVVGNVDEEEVIRAYEQFFHLPRGPFAGGTTEPPLPDPEPFRIHTESRLYQVQLAMGVRVPEYLHADRPALVVLNAVLGGGMSSRLFVKLREQKGVVYSVSSYLDYLRGLGVLGIHTVTDPAYFEGVVRDIWVEFEALRKEGIRPEELERVKTRLRGSLLLSQESLTQRMMHVATLELLLGRVLTTEEYLRDLEQVTCQQVQEVAQRYLVWDAWSVGIVSPVEIPLETFPGGKPWKAMASPRS